MEIFVICFEVAKRNEWGLVENNNFRNGIAVKKTSMVKGEVAT